MVCEGKGCLLLQADELLARGEIFVYTPSRRPPDFSFVLGTICRHVLADVKKEDSRLFFEVSDFGPAGRAPAPQSEDPRAVPRAVPVAGCAALELSGPQRCQVVK